MEKRKHIDLLLSVLAWALLCLMFSWAVRDTPARRDLRGCGPVLLPPSSAKYRGKGERIDLARQYAYYNTEYFEGKLPRNVDVAYHDTGRAEAEDGSTVGPERLAVTFEDGGRLHVWLDPDLCAAPIVAQATLLHECVHVLLWGKEFENHGKRFKMELRRLIAAGAFDDLL